MLAVTAPLVERLYGHMADDTHLRTCGIILIGLLCGVGLIPPSMEELLHIILGH